MKPYLIIECNQGEWIKSVIRVMNLKNALGRDYNMSVTFIEAEKLPTDLRNIFMGIVKSLQVQGDQEWFVNSVKCTDKIEKVITGKNELIQEYIELELDLDFPDFTKGKSILKEYNELVKSLYKELTDNKFWELYLRTGYAGETKTEEYKG